MTYVEPYQNISEKNSRKCSSEDWSNGPIKLKCMPYYWSDFSSLQYNTLLLSEMLSLSCSEISTYKKIHSELKNVHNVLVYYPTPDVGVNTNNRGAVRATLPNYRHKIDRDIILSSSDDDDEYRSQSNL